MHIYIRDNCGIVFPWSCLNINRRKWVPPLSLNFSEIPQDSLVGSPWRCFRLLLRSSWRFCAWLSDFSSKTPWGERPDQSRSVQVRQPDHGWTRICRTTQKSAGNTTVLYCIAHHTINILHYSNNKVVSERNLTLSLSFTPIVQSIKALILIIILLIIIYDVNI